MSHRHFKDVLYSQFARIGHALSSPKRIELLDLLGQSEKTVEELAGACAMPVKNTSAHLRVLRQARLVETRKEGTSVFYRLADDSVAPVLHALQRTARRRLTEVEQVTRMYLDDRDALQPVTLAELKRRLRNGSATVIDVRPRAEFEAGHIPGAISMPVDELPRLARKLSKARDVIAYCRGPYCLYSVDAVTLLRRRGFAARRAENGFPEWRATGGPVAVGVE